MPLFFLSACHAVVLLPVSAGRNRGGGCAVYIVLHLHIATLWSEYYCLQGGDITSLLPGWEIRGCHQWNGRDSLLSLCLSQAQTSQSY